MKKNLVKELAKGGVCVASSVILAASMCGTAFADKAARDSFDVPTSAMDPTNYENGNERVLTAIGAHGSAVVGEYVGLSETINQTLATSGNGVSTENYMNNPLYGIYGSSANEHPDPYVSNLFYKWYLKASGQTAAADAVQHYMYNYMFDGYSGSCVNSDSKSLLNGTTIALSERPDVIVAKPGKENGFDEEIAKINNFKSEGSEYYKGPSDKYVGDENYNPQKATYTECLTKGFIDSVYNVADAALAAYDYSWEGTSQQAKVCLRYGNDAALGTAQKYEKYTLGTDLYVLSKIADGTVSKKTVAYVTSVSGSGKDAIFTIQGNLDVTKSGESNTHFLEPLTATCENLANVLDPNLTLEAKRGQTTTCTVDQLATADVIMLTLPDNFAFNNLGTDTTYRPNSEIRAGDADQGESSWRAYVDTEGNKHYKNQFNGPTATNATLVSNIQDALADAGYTEKSEQAIISCLYENASCCDGGSVDSMALHGIVNGFAYPEIMNPLEQYGWFLNNIAHIKTNRVADMVQKLCADMTLPDGITMDSITGYNATTSKTLEAQYDEGWTYYKKNMASINALYPQYAEWQSGRVDESSNVKRAAQSVSFASTTLTIAAGKSTANLATKGANTAVTYQLVDGENGINLSSDGKVTVNSSLAAGKYSIVVTASAAQTDRYYAASVTKLITVKVYRASNAKITTSTLKIKAGKSKTAKATAKTAVTFKKVSGNKKITVAKSGKVTVKKGLKKGTYKVKIKVTAAASGYYAKSTATKIIKVKVTK